MYEAAPQVRNLMKEATRFMPTSVAQKMRLAKGEGRLLEPEEFDKLKEEGYMNEEKKDEDKKEEEKKDVPAEADPELDAFLSSHGLDVAASCQQWGGRAGKGKKGTYLLAESDILLPVALRYLDCVIDVGDFDAVVGDV